MKSFIQFVFFLCLLFCWTLRQAGAQTNSPTPEDSLKVRQSIADSGHLSVDSGAAILHFPSLVSNNSETFNAQAAKPSLNNALTAAYQHFFSPTQTGRKASQKKVGQPISKQKTSSVVWLSLGLALLLGLFRQFQASHLTNTFAALRRPTNTNRQVADNIKQEILPGYFLDLLYVLSISFFLLQLIHYFKLSSHKGSSFDDWNLLALFVGLISLIILSRRIFLKGAGWLFDLSSLTSTYLLTISLFNRSLGVLLIPIGLILAFAKGQWLSIVAVIGLFLMALFYLFRFIRSSSEIRYFIKLSKFHFILYLCAFEIMPILILWKIIMMNRPFI